MDMASDHVLLWPHTQTICSLWFNGSGQSASTVVGELWREHQKLVGGWFSFSHFLNGSDFIGLVEGGYGKLAEGPESIITIYRQVMEKHSFKVSITTRPPLHWNGQHWVEPGDLIALLVGKSRIIASTVEGQRME